MFMQSNVNRLNTVNLNNNNNKSNVNIIPNNNNNNFDFSYQNIAMAPPSPSPQSPLSSPTKSIPVLPKPSAMKTKQSQDINSKVPKSKNVAKSKPIVLPPKKKILQDKQKEQMEREQKEREQKEKEQKEREQKEKEQKEKESASVKLPTPIPVPPIVQPQKLKTSIWNPALKNILSKTPSKEITDIVSRDNYYDANKWKLLGIDQSHIPTIPADSRTRVPKSVRQTMLYYIIEKCIDKFPKDKVIEDAVKIEESIYVDSQSKNVYLNLISIELTNFINNIASERNYI
ncbi:hypothetical protein DLAC_11685 [Tieghemostelium lacteum]|uniref:RNA exonuclease 1 homolog-like domain-containing protein n=1 Tax=Tieghemostelium lacteum TaxID=361077 RepID=A0A151ZCB4_TIELA|nr:hypothetical protein DLAC_11685 [Tieghemostelium lacteum]|eukprot:KYQ91581.1 hypothetical protein DLAC_11685 [Tieghemostelium lacteum]